MSQYPTSPQPGYPSGGQPEKSTPGLAIAALVCAVPGLCFTPLAIAALVMGIISLSKTRDGAPGRGMAVAGTVLGAVGMVASIAALLIAIMLPALGAARRTAQRMQNATQVRGIHQGLVTYANSNKNNFPGLTSSGSVLADGAATGNSGDGSTPQARYWILLDGYFFTPEYAISPSEIEPITAYMGSGPVMSNNYSYAMLEYKTTGAVQTDSFSGEQTYAVDGRTQGRAQEWTQTLSPQAIVMSDRNIGSDGTNGVDSIHAESPGSWKGAALWNDNHVAFEMTNYFDTKYANGPYNTGDNLFEEDGTGGYDALLVHE